MKGYEQAPERKRIHINDIEIHEMPTDYLMETRERAIETMKALNEAMKHLRESYDERKGMVDEAYRIGWQAGERLVQEAYQASATECTCIDQEIKDRKMGYRGAIEPDAMFGWDRPRWDADIPVKSL